MSGVGESSFRGDHGPRGTATRFAELCALWGFAGAQPLLDVFGRSPETFVFLRVDRGAIVWFAVLVCLVPPLALIALEELTRVVRRGAPQQVHSVLAVLLAAAVSVQVVKRAFGWRGTLAVVVALAVGGMAGLAHRRAAPVRMWLRYASPAPAVFAVLFLVVSPVSALLGGGSGVGSGSRVAAGGNGAPVVVLVLDEFPLATLLAPDGSLDAAQFPGFARLAESSTWYRNATSVQGETTLALPAILAGRYPTQGNAAPAWTNYRENLFTLLGSVYEMNVRESWTALCPRSLCDTDAAGGPLGLGALLGEARSVWADLVSPQVAPTDLATFAEPESTSVAQHLVQFLTHPERRSPRFAAFLDSLGQTTHHRSLSFLHVVLPHDPFVHLPSGATYEAPDLRAYLTPALHWPKREWAAMLGRQRHLLQARYVDTLITDLLDRLEETGLDDDAWLVVVADHGASFTPDESYKYAGEGNYPEILWVPFFVRPPGGNGGTLNDANVETIDVLPTIADAIDVKVPWDIDGRSALGEPRASDEKHYQRFERDGYEPLPDDLLTFDAGEGHSRLSELVYPSARKGDPAWWPYQIGAHAGLVGRSADDLAVGDAVGTATLDTAFPAEIAQNASALPAWVSGHVERDRGGEEPAVVALAVDGVIGAVVPTFDDSDSTAFEAMLPEPLLGRGPHRLDAYLVNDRGANGTVLRPLRFP